MRFSAKDFREVASNKIYARRIGHNCLMQYNECLAQDGVMKGVLLPSAHTGHMAPRGSIFTTMNNIYPEWVGFDIGCGTLSLPTSFKVEDIIKQGRWIFRDLMWKSSINNKVVSTVNMPKNITTDGLSTLGQAVFDSDKCFGYRQLGTLGGGDHFLEIGADDSGLVWITVHSGSRGAGAKIANAHMLRAKQLHTGEQDDHLSFRVGSQEALDYINDVNWLVHFASINRHYVAKTAQEVLSRHCEGSVYINGGAVETTHNSLEVTNGNYFHRNGAAIADDGSRINIMANVRDGILLCRGNGIYDSLYSCSSSSGRSCSRLVAEAMGDIETFKKDTKDIVCSTSEKFLTTNPRAYKDMGNVLLLQDELVEVKGHITPIINVRS